MSRPMGSAEELERRRSRAMRALKEGQSPCGQTQGIAARGVACGNRGGSGGPAGQGGFPRAGRTPARPGCLSRLWPGFPGRLSYFATPKWTGEVEDCPGKYRSVKSEKEGGEV